jgi:hypothetical protein
VAAELILEDAVFVTITIARGCHGIEYGQQISSNSTESGKTQRSVAASAIHLNEYPTKYALYNFDFPRSDDQQRDDRKEGNQYMIENTGETSGRRE